MFARARRARGRTPTMSWGTRIVRILSKRDIIDGGIAGFPGEHLGILRYFHGKSRDFGDDTRGDPRRFAAPAWRAPGHTRRPPLQRREWAPIPHRSSARGGWVRTGLSRAAAREIRAVPGSSASRSARASTAGCARRISDNCSRNIRAPSACSTRFHGPRHGTPALLSRSRIRAPRRLERVPRPQRHAASQRRRRGARSPASSACSGNCIAARRCIAISRRSTCSCAMTDASSSATSASFDSRAIERGVTRAHDERVDRAERSCWRAPRPKWQARDDVYQVGQLLGMLIKGDARTRLRPHDVRRLPCSDHLEGDRASLHRRAAQARTRAPTR